MSDNNDSQFSNGIIIGLVIGITLGSAATMLVWILVEMLT